jgi:hypothetical protein
MLEISCSDCGGSCCKGVTVPLPSVTNEGQRQWMETRGRILGGYWHIRSVCCHLQSGRCSRYDERPEMCRRYEVGGERCLRARRVFGGISNEA